MVVVVVVVVVVVLVVVVLVLVLVVVLVVVVMFIVVRPLSGRELEQEDMEGGRHAGGAPPFTQIAFPWPACVPPAFPLLFAALIFPLKYSFPFILRHPYAQLSLLNAY